MTLYPILVLLQLAGSLCLKAAHRIVLPDQTVSFQSRVKIRSRAPHSIGVLSRPARLSKTPFQLPRVNIELSSGFK